MWNILGNRKPKGKIFSRTPNPKVSGWLATVPKQCRSSGVEDYIDGRKAAMANLRAGNIQRFNITGQFQSKFFLMSESF